MCIMFHHFPHACLGAKIALQFRVDWGEKLRKREVTVAHVMSYWEELTNHQKLEAESFKQ